MQLSQRDDDKSKHGSNRNVASVQFTSSRNNNSNSNANNAGNSNNNSNFGGGGGVPNSQVYRQLQQRPPEFFPLQTAAHAGSGSKMTYRSNTTSQDSRVPTTVSQGRTLTKPYSQENLRFYAKYTNMSQSEYDAEADQMQFQPLSARMHNGAFDFGQHSKSQQKYFPATSRNFTSQSHRQMKSETQPTQSSQAEKRTATQAKPYRNFQELGSPNQGYEFQHQFSNFPFFTPQPNVNPLFDNNAGSAQQNFASPSHYYQQKYPPPQTYLVRNVINE